MSFPALHGMTAASGGTTPLDYGANLVEYWDSDEGVTDSGGVVSNWEGRSSSAFDLTVPSSNTGPDVVSNDQNGFDTILFEDKTTGGDRLRRKLSSSNSAFDNLFSNSGSQGIAFAARLDASTGGFNTNNTIVSKGINHREGWTLEVLTSGTMRFRHYMDDESQYQINASGFFSGGSFPKLILGSVRYSGGNTSGSATLRLYNGSSFVETGTVTTASSSTLVDDSARDLVVGNILNDSNNNLNAPFEGVIMGVWITDPFTSSVDDEYLLRWVP